MISLSDPHNQMRRNAVWILCVPWLSCGCTAPALSEQQVWEIRQMALAELKLSAATGDDPQTRVRALRGLAEDGKAHLDSWTRLASYDPNPEVRLAAILILRDQSAALATDFWMRLLEDEDELVRAGAMLCLLDSGRVEHSETLENLRPAEWDPGRRRSAIPLLLALNERADDEEVRRRLNAAGDSDGALRFAALASLVARGDPGITREMILQAQAAGDHEQVTAIELLSLSADPNVLYILSERLENCESLEGRLKAARGLGRFGSDAGLQLAMECLKFESQSVDGAGSSRASNIRTSACEVCAEATSLDALLAASERITADDDSGVRVACAAAVLRILTRREGASR